MDRAVQAFRAQVAQLDSSKHAKTLEPGVTGDDPKGLQVTPLHEVERPDRPHLSKKNTFQIDPIYHSFDWSV